MDLDWLPGASLSPWTSLSIPVPLVLFVLWVRARGDDDENGARKIFLAGIGYFVILSGGYPIAALLVCTGIVLWALGVVDALVHPPNVSNVAPKVSDAVSKPIADSTAPTPAKSVADTGDIKLAKRFGLPQAPGGIEPLSLLDESGKSILDDTDWIAVNVGNGAARSLEKHGVQTLRGVIGFSENELQAFEEHAGCKFASELVYDMALMAGAYKVAEQSSFYREQFAQTNAKPSVDIKSTEKRNFRDDLSQELVRLGCRFDGIHVILPSGGKRVAVSTFDFLDLLDELKGNQSRPEQ